MWLRRRCIVWAVSRFWGIRKNWMTSRRELSSLSSWVGRVNHSLGWGGWDGKIRNHITWQYMSAACYRNEFARAAPCLCSHVCIYRLKIAGCPYVYVCMSWFWWMRPCVTPCGYVMEHVNILEQEQCVVVFVCQHSSSLQLSGSGWVSTSLLSVCSCYSILEKQLRWNFIFPCVNACA